MATAPYGAWESPITAMAVTGAAMVLSTLPGARAGLSLALRAGRAEVHAALRGDRSPAECLTEAANQWRKITQDLGVENQRRAYWRSLGKNPP
mgnify:CR=1 FL=1